MSTFCYERKGHDIVYNVCHVQEGDMQVLRKEQVNAHMVIFPRERS